ncbi:MAG TPA: hypothetical protein VHA52_08195 [Candidatus Babeliaceae bacterium]|nr:hypothetical protein [Candidatus Babeliaceae bacterium]
MKLFPFILATAFAALTSCTPKHHPSQPPGTDTTGNGSGASVDTSGSAPISVDTANAMISSYLKGANCYAIVDTNLKSLIVNADTLRAYLNDTSIKSLKLMFAEKTSYINACGFGANAGYSSRGLTLVIVGVNRSGNYVLNSQGMVYDRCNACPTVCPVGTASNDLIVESKK